VPGEDRGGYDPGYGVQHVGAHWVAVGAFSLLTIALLRDLNTAIRRRARDQAEPRRVERERPVRA